MRYLAIYFSIILLLFSCSEKSNQPLRGNKAATFMLGDDSAETVVWQLINTHDPYNGGVSYPQDPANPHYILLHKNGAFKEHDNANVSFGNWYLNKNKNRLALVYYIQNGISIPDEKQVIDYRYEVKKVSKDSLILGIQGRHGIVTQTYISTTSAPDNIRRNPWQDKIPEIDLDDESIWQGADDENSLDKKDIETWSPVRRKDSLINDPDSLK